MNSRSVTTFKYLKEGKETERSLFVLKEDDEHLAGLDLGKLSPEERSSLLEKSRALEAEIDKLLTKSYRQFFINAISNRT